MVAKKNSVRAVCFLTYCIFMLLLSSQCPISMAAENLEPPDEIEDVYQYFEENMASYIEEDFSLYPIDAPKVEKSLTSWQLSYGTTKIVASSYPVPSGWIVTHNYYNKTKTIKYVGGAKYGAKEVAVNFSPVPPNWIITQVTGAYESNRQKYIKYVGGAKYGAKEVVSNYGDIPSNWIITQVTGSYESNRKRYIKYVGGATSGQKEVVSNYGRIPTDWVITKVTGFSAGNRLRYIEYVGGATYGDRKNISEYGDIPHDWAVLEVMHDRKRLIMFMGNPPSYGLIQDVAPYGDVPTNWAIKDFIGSNGLSGKRLIYLGKASVDQIETIQQKGPLPPGWFVVSYDYPMRTIQFVGY